MQSIARDRSHLATLLYAYQVKRASYWRNNETSFTSGLARYISLKNSEANKAAMNQALLVALGQEAQRRRDALIDSVDDSETLDVERQEDIYNELQDYQRVIFGAADLLDEVGKDSPDGIA